VKSYASRADDDRAPRAVLAAAFARRAAVERVNGDGQVAMTLQFAIGDKAIPLTLRATMVKSLQRE